MKNPLKEVALFSTPTSFRDLEEYCTRFSGAERVVAMTVMCMTNNLCHSIVEQAIKDEDTLKRGVFMFRRSDYASPVEAEQDGALYDTGIKLTKAEFELQRPMLEAAMKATESCINHGQSDVCLVLMGVLA